jgi:hypothetical protein
MDSTPNEFNPNWDSTPNGLDPDWDSTPDRDSTPTGTQLRIPLNLEWHNYLHQLNILPFSLNMKQGAPVSKEWI